MTKIWRPRLNCTCWPHCCTCAFFSPACTAVGVESWAAPTHRAAAPAAVGCAGAPSLSPYRSQSVPHHLVPAASCHVLAPEIRKRLSLPQAKIGALFGQLRQDLLEEMFELIVLPADVRTVQGSVTCPRLSRAVVRRKTVRGTDGASNGPTQPLLAPKLLGGVAIAPSVPRVTTTCMTTGPFPVCHQFA